MIDHLSMLVKPAVQAYGEDDYIIFDCPGQIELYSHLSVFRSFVDFLKRDAWSVAAVYCIDCQFVGDPTKFIAGSLQAMSAMVQLELPHVNILTKVDLLGDENKVCCTGMCPCHKHHFMCMVARMLIVADIEALTTNISCVGNLHRCLHDLNRIVMASNIRERLGQHSWLALLYGRAAKQALLHVCNCF